MPAIDVMMLWKTIILWLVSGKTGQSYAVSAAV
jgi:hypothetical protein